MRAYIITDNNMGVNAAFSEKDELIKRFTNHLNELDADEKITEALNRGGSFSITVEVAEISKDEFDKINSAYD